MAPHSEPNPAHDGDPTRVDSVALSAAYSQSKPRLQKNLRAISVGALEYPYLVSK